MEPVRIFYPVTALATLTLLVLLAVPIARFRAFAQRRVTIDDFRLGESANVPEGVSLPNRNYMNLLQQPVLFYVVCLALFVTGLVDDATLTLAWVFVALRAVHSLVHTTYNNVVHRLIAFASSNLVLVVLWVLFFVGLLSKTS